MQENRRLSVTFVRKLKRICLFILSLNSWQSCQTDKSTEFDCSRTRLLAPYTFQLTYRSPLVEAQRKANSKADIQDQLKKERQMQYFDLQITTPSQYWSAEELYNLTYHFQDDIHIEMYEVKDTTILPCVLFHYESANVGTSTHQFVLGFENPNQTTTPGVVVLNSNVLNVGVVKLKVDCSN